MNVGILTAHLNVDEHGGSNYSIHRLGTELEKRGHNVTVYTLNFWEQNGVPVDHQYTIQETDIDYETVFDLGTKLYLKIEDWVQPQDVFHVYSPLFVPFFGVYQNRSDTETQIVATLNNYNAFCTNPSKMRDGCWEECSLSKKITHAGDSISERTIKSPRAFFKHYSKGPLNAIDNYLCLSPSVKQIHSQNGIDETRLNVVPNMIDPTFQTVERQSSDEQRLLYVGRVEDMKGIPILLEGVSQIQSREFHVDVVGDDIFDQSEGIESYKETAAELGISDKLTLHRWDEDDKRSKKYARADGFSHTRGWPETVGRTIIEAMQHQLPIICSNIGAPPWVAGSAGVSYPEADSEALADELEHVLFDENTLRNLRENIPKELERFHPETVIDQILDLYQADSV